MRSSHRLVGVLLALTGACSERTRIPQHRAERCRQAYRQILDGVDLDVAARIQRAMPEAQFAPKCMALPDAAKPCLDIAQLSPGDPAIRKLACPNATVTESLTAAIPITDQPVPR